MTQFFMPTQGPGVGLFPSTLGPIDAYNRTGASVAQYEVLAFDLEGTDADSSTLTPGGSDSVWANLIDPTAGMGGAVNDQLNILCVALEAAAADNDLISVLPMGFTKANIKDREGSPTAKSPGSPLFLDTTTTNNFDMDPTSTGPIYGQLNASGTFTTTDSLQDIYINGLRGLFASS